MDEHILINLAGILILGIGAQWLAWRVGVPSILVLLLAGFVAGPLTGFLDPDVLFGAVLSPAVSLAVALILFEGGLSLRLDELREIRRVVRLLISVGALLTWLIGAGAAILILDLPWRVALLLGAILVVSGPTVVMPLLKHVRPTAAVGAILKWEGIFIDAVGATLAVVVFETIRSGVTEEPTPPALLRLLTTFGVGAVLGIIGAVLLIVLLRRNWVPEHLQNPVALMLVTGVFAAAERLAGESGLLAAIVMGLVVANQRRISVRHIVAYQESVGLLLISTLFILLAARLRREDLLAVLNLRGLAFLAVLIVVARPLVVAVATFRSGLAGRERAFLAWLAPRGIVAASAASVFALRLADEGLVGADRLVPLTFLTIIGTVAVYGLTAAPVSRWLGVTQRTGGMLILGAQPFARMLAAAIQEVGLPVLVVPTDPEEGEAARRAGLPVFEGSVLSEEAEETLPLEGLSQLLALSANDEYNALACLRFAEHFGGGAVYQLSSSDATAGTVAHLRGHPLFASELTHAALRERVAAGATIRQFAATPNPDTTASPLVLLDSTGTLTPATAERAASQSGQAGIYLVGPVSAAAAATPLSTAKDAAVDRER